MAVVTAFILLLTSHLLASRGFWASIRRKQLPNTVDFAMVSFLLYYDLGMGFEALGVPYVNEYFLSFFGANETISSIGFVILFFAPWILRLGSKQTVPPKAFSPDSVTSLAPRANFLFLILALLVSVWMAQFGVELLQSSVEIWTARSAVGETLGPLSIILYLPLHFVAFYARQRNAHSSLGTVALVVLVILSALSTLAFGQRTAVLLPFVIFALFRFRVSTARMASVGLLSIGAATVLLSSFKWYAGSSSSAQDLAAYTINSDLARAGVLSKAVELSLPFGTEVMPFPGSGYVYSALYFIPRSIAPFKGESTSRYFTGVVSGEHLPNWGFGIGMLEEIAINFGWVLVLPIIFLYGMAFGWFDRLSIRVPAVVIPTRLAGIWICGYHLPALVLLFGSMTIVVLLLDAIFKPERSEVASSTDGSLSVEQTNGPVRVPASTIHTKLEGMGKK